VKRKHVTLTFEQKAQIVAEIEAGGAKDDVMSKYNIGRQTLAHIEAAKGDIDNEGKNNLFFRFQILIFLDFSVKSGKGAKKRRHK
jgi:hypothetical protein